MRARGRSRALAAHAPRRRALAAAALAFTLALATAASAHHGEPATGEDEVGTLGSQNTGGQVSTDTELTPVGKDGAAAGWQQIAGSRWRSDGDITHMASPNPGEPSPTPYDLDFYGVGFLKVDVAMANGLSQDAAGSVAQTNGFAVGAQCRREDPDTPVPADEVAGCERVPVIYRYYEHPTKGLIWEESWRGSDESDPGGFVASVAWLSPPKPAKDGQPASSGTALAVGGTGTYPRRERELRPDQVAGPGSCEDQAGDAELGTIQGSAEATPPAAVDAANPNEPPSHSADVGPANVSGNLNSPLWLRSATLEAGSFKAEYESQVDFRGNPSATSPSASASTPLASGRAGTGSASIASASLMNGALEAEGPPQSINPIHPVTRTKVKRGAYERELEKCAGRARVENDLDVEDELQPGAGMARAWLFSGGSWKEIADLPSEMRALQALDVSPRPADCGQDVARECAIAGGMRQLWEFSDGAFREGLGPDFSDGAGMENPDSFRFRVRDIRFAPAWRVDFSGVKPTGNSQPAFGPFAVAVTAGCCSVDRTYDRPARLWLRASGWNTADGLGSTAADNNEIEYTALGDNGSFNPDSYYAVNVLFEGKLFALRTPGGPSERYGQREPPSRFTGGISTFFGAENCDTEGCAIRGSFSPGSGSPTGGTTLSTLRLVSADGDSRGGAAQRPDGTPDWAVGVLRSSGQGVAYHTAFSANNQGSYFAKPQQCEEDEALAPVGQSESTNPCNFEAYQRRNASKALYALGSYALNAYRVAGEDPVAGKEGTGWAVGDHGAIATRGGGVATAEASPARRGAKITSEPVPGAEAFDDQRVPVSDEPGAVPALLPGQRPTEPGFTEGQNPFGDTGVRGWADLIVMSRDGSEGWAMRKSGQGGSGSAFYRFDGQRWAPCDPKGVGNLIPPDPACAKLPADGGIFALTRVPLERDTDPSNDDEFEAVALTCSQVDNQGACGGGPALYRLRDGRWSLDEDARVGGSPVTGTDIAFAAPDDGWVTRIDGGAQSGFWLGVSHFDGTGWVDCTPPSGDPPQSCGDSARHLSVELDCRQLAPHLAQADERVYLFATREGRPPASPIGSRCGLRPPPPEPYPLILYHDAGEPCVKPDDPGCWRGGKDTTDDGTYNPTDGGWDPGCVEGSGAGCVATAEPGDRDHQGRVESLSVARNADGSYAGWAIGIFGGEDRASADTAVMMRLSDGTDVPDRDGPAPVAWRPWSVPDAANEYLRLGYGDFGGGEPEGFELLTLPAQAGRSNAFLSISGQGIPTTVWYNRHQGHPPLLAYDQERGRWTVVPTPWSASPPTQALAYTAGTIRAIAPDNRGGFWAAVLGDDPRVVSFHHYTDRAPSEPFAETPDPTTGSSRITAMDAGADGTVWLGDASGSLYRYDRLAGWSRRLRVPGWDPPRTTRAAVVSAIAVGPDGSGVAVGPGGRIATLGSALRLDPAATVGCNPQAVVPPCGTGQDLHAADVAPDGSAIVAGNNRALLWRPAGGEFRTIAPPPVPRATPIIRVEMPRPDRAYLLTEAACCRTPASRVIAGEMSDPGVWSWRIEVGDSGGAFDPLTASPTQIRALRDIAVDGAGPGYAVGDSGIVLERTGEGEWRRLPRADQDDLRAVALPAGGGPGALIGGAGGRILTLANGDFQVARHADFFDPVGATEWSAPADVIAPAIDVVEVALAPGYAPGEAEAWALRQGPRKGIVNNVQALLHYPAVPPDPRLDPSRGLAALADAPVPRADELTFAAFGKQECDAVTLAGTREPCGPPNGSNVTAELIARRVSEELLEQPTDEAKPRFALFTGDATDAPGGKQVVTAAGTTVRSPLDPNLKHRQWVELVADPLAEQGLAVLGAIGGQDLARTAQGCHVGSTSGNLLRILTGTNCLPQSNAIVEQAVPRAGLNLPWRTTMAFAPAPWEREQEAEGLRFERVGTGALSQPGPDAEVPALGAGNVSTGARTERYRLDAGDTHYAVDAINEETDETVARIVVVDTSMRSVAASDPLQHPIEAGGQLRWLEEVLCFEGSAEDTDGDVHDCTRESGQQAIVLSNTPTYSYGPISPEETQTDAAAFEAVLLKNRVNVVVSGRLGWNGRYWTLAPGVHAPCPGQDYRSDSQAPSLDQPEICGVSAVGGTQDVVPDPNQVIDDLPEDAKQAAGLAGRGAIPFVVSSTAGGRFNTKAERGGFATAENGFWRGYSIVRLHPSGDPAKTIVEQRPILDWVGLSASDPAVAPGQRLQLESFAREAFGMDTAPRYYEIPEAQVITHRWHLLLVHPDEPWRACEAADSTCQAYYSKLAEGPRSLGSAGASGTGSARDDMGGASASASAAAEGEGADDNPCAPYLCLPERVGTIDPDTGDVRAGNGKYPDTFAIATLSVGEHVAAQPLVFTKSPSFVVSGFAQPPELPSPGANLANAPTAPAPPPTPKPPTPQANIPEPPLPPAVPPLTAAQPPEPQPPAPPAPPPPTEQPSPLNLTLAPPGITVATPTAVIQPPTPPVNPAPPGGARREARQRQAAAQKSGADNDEKQGEGGTPDALDSRTQPATRRDRTRPEPSFTALARAEQPSAWAQGLLYGGGITLAAALLALGWSGVRPTPRRRPPEVPAPARAYVTRR